ncbi:MAG TPA: hypothetical protein VFQ61_00110 [Polyangiaceae bacterium]|nr:hypothetical protein [Polyangiaceae bacterium]
MRYRAVAVASAESNAVGAVELECTPHGLFIAYLGVGAFTEGYAPGALASGTGLTVPWTQVSEARLEGERLLLAIDHKLTPLNRLLLTEFETGRRIPKEELAKRRLLVRFSSLAAALVAALILGAFVLRSSPETSASAAVALALLAALVLMTMGFLVDRSMESSAEDRAAFENFAREISQYLPTLVQLPHAPRARKPLPDVSELQGLLPRTTLAIVITLTSGLLSVLLVARWVTNNQAEVRSVTSRMLEPAAPREAAAAARPQAAPKAPKPSSPPQVAAARDVAATPASSGPGQGFGDECRCVRPDSALWSRPLPRLSVLTISKRLRLGKNPDENKRKKYLELDLAVVNNSNKDIEEIALMVLFYDRDPPPSNRRNQVSNRPLFFEGPLQPGQAIKWSVEAEGTEFEVQNPIAGSLTPEGDDIAPANRLAELLSARNRPVRLHGAMLLTFLSDPRAREGALGLREALREDEAPYLSRLIQALGDVRVCQLRVSSGPGPARTVNACVHNTSKEPKKELGMKLRGLENAPDLGNPSADPPTVQFETTVHLPGELGAGAARTVRFPVDLGSAAPTIYEAYVDRFDLLASP